MCEIYEEVKAKALEEGEGSHDKKIVALANLLQELNPVRAKFVQELIGL